MWFGTFTLGSAASRGLEVWTCHLQGMLSSPWGMSPVSFKQIGKCSFFRGNWDKGPSSAPPPSLQGRCMAGSSWCDLVHLLWAVLLQGDWRYGPAIFRRCCPHHEACPLWVSSRLENVHFSGEIETRGLTVQLPQVHKGDAWPAAPDVIWHIYSRQPCSKGKEAFTSCFCGTPSHAQGQVPCEFWADQPRFIFQR